MMKTFTAIAFQFFSMENASAAATSRIQGGQILMYKILYNTSGEK